jgi:hypothetical protein
MNNRKSILYILLIVLGLILGYNYMIAPLLMQYNAGMGMGMHWRMYAGTSYFIDARFILLIAITIAGLLLFEILKPQTQSPKCSKCGMKMENDRWRVCPQCGNPVENRKG